MRTGSGTTADREARYTITRPCRVKSGCIPSRSRRVLRSLRHRRDRHHQRHSGEFAAVRTVQPGRPSPRRDTSAVDGSGRSPHQTRAGSDPPRPSSEGAGLAGHPIADRRLSVRPSGSGGDRLGSEPDDESDEHPGDVRGAHAVPCQVGRRTRREQPEVPAVVRREHRREAAGTFSRPASPPVVRRAADSTGRTEHGRRPLAGGRELGRSRVREDGRVSSPGDRPPGRPSERGRDRPDTIPPPRRRPRRGRGRHVQLRPEEPPQRTRLSLHCEPRDPARRLSSEPRGRPAEADRSVDVAAGRPAPRQASWRGRAEAVRSPYRGGERVAGREARGSVPLSRSWCVMT
ncbi:hypothetical protein UA75_15060 [Actinoalloteichus sp. GBA129-24]|uniref:Uncharacterized protein n=1 Tax=Actinoalloteichus fjordicus TaxID=1612552 RepID=A0AAC9LCB0_9PSEU|nr:hypothetical protein UA74_14470 [Actinoalloteichus fjordicus]APU21022.1 hypothetical protein UA75_15060 [Actinoalloteichus sp. GBA129-24]